jgi:hypothetical protein
MDLSNIPIAARFNVSINTFQLPSFSTGVEFRVVHILKFIQDFWSLRSYLGNTRRSFFNFLFRNPKELHRKRFGHVKCVCQSTREHLTLEDKLKHHLHNLYSPLHICYPFICTLLATLYRRQGFLAITCASPRPKTLWSACLVDDHEIFNLQARIEHCSSLSLFHRRNTSIQIPRRLLQAFKHRSLHSHNPSFDYQASAFQGQSTRQFGSLRHTTKSRLSSPITGPRWIF